MTPFRDAWWTFIGDLAVVSVVAVPVAVIVGMLVWWMKGKAGDPLFAGAFAGVIVYMMALAVALFGTQSW